MCPSPTIKCTKGGGREGGRARVWRCTTWTWSSHCTSGWGDDSLTIGTYFIGRRHPRSRPPPAGNDCCSPRWSTVYHFLN